MEDSTIIILGIWAFLSILLDLVISLRLDFITSLQMDETDTFILFDYLKERLLIFRKITYFYEVLLFIICLPSYILTNTFFALLWVLWIIFRKVLLYKIRK
jgi:hypothetical protein